MNKIGKKIVLIDVDGTIIDFKSIDKRIIANMFGNNIAVKIIDKILWCVNDLDYLSNSKFAFLLRMRIYSLSSSWRFEDAVEEYGKQYIEFANIELQKKDKLVKKMENRGYYIIVVTQNMFSEELSKNFSFEVKYIPNKRVYYKNNYSNCNISYVVGNNYMDDVISTLYLNRAYRRKKSSNLAIPVYIGKSKIVKILTKFKNGKSFETLEDFVKEIK